MNTSASAELAPVELYSNAVLIFKGVQLGVVWGFFLVGVFFWHFGWVFFFWF